MPEQEGVKGQSGAGMAGNPLRQGQLKGRAALRRKPSWHVGRKALAEHLRPGSWLT